MKTVTIFEGPDGGGKTFAARSYATRVGARYVHLGSLLRIKKSLPRIYLEAMLPALQGYQDVVLDRCWLSEQPYADAFRNGVRRLDVVDIRMLERVALAVDARVVLCRPKFEVCVQNFLSRKSEEYLDTPDQLRRVWESYGQLRSALVVQTLDYTEDDSNLFLNMLAGVRRRPHPVTFEGRTAGSLDAMIALVGEGFAEPKEHDLLHQRPFVSFSKLGCSRWLTQQLEGVWPEGNLFWVNADDLNPAVLEHLRTEAMPKIVALGGKAHRALDEHGLAHATLEHPQAWKRFRSSEPYPLKELLR